MEKWKKHNKILFKWFHSLIVLPTVSCVPTYQQQRQQPHHVMPWQGIKTNICNIHKLLQLNSNLWSIAIISVRLLFFLQSFFYGLFIYYQLFSQYVLACVLVHIILDFALSWRFSLKSDRMNAKPGMFNFILENDCCCCSLKTRWGLQMNSNTLLQYQLQNAFKSWIKPVFIDVVDEKPLKV